MRHFTSSRSAAIVVDFGSSICVDVVSAKGEFLGGAIAPGVQVSSDAAAARSAALRRVELTRPRSVIGKNTVECMQAGAVFGFAGLVDGLIRRIREDVDGFGGDDVVVVATGHTAPLLLPDLQTPTRYDRHLTLDGLRLVSSATATLSAASADPSTAERTFRREFFRRFAPFRRSRADQKNVRINSTTRLSALSTGIDLPLVEHRAWMRDAELDPVADLKSRGRAAPSGTRAGR